MPGLGMKYFVLKPAGDDEYAQASRLAMDYYARCIKAVNQELADELRIWIGKEAIATASRNRVKNAGKKK